MPCKEDNPGKHKKEHTPIVSEAQQGAMGAALAAKRGTLKGPLRGPARGIAVSMSQAELSRHLKESAGRKLVVRKTRKKVYG